MSPAAVATTSPAPPRSFSPMRAPSPARSVCSPASSSPPAAGTSSASTGSAHKRGEMAGMFSSAAPVHPRGNAACSTSSWMTSTTTSSSTSWDARADRLKKPIGELAGWSRLHGRASARAGVGRQDRRPLRRHQVCRPRGRRRGLRDSRAAQAPRPVRDAARHQLDRSEGYAKLRLLPEPSLANTPLLKAMLPQLMKVDPERGPGAAEHAAPDWTCSTQEGVLMAMPQEILIR